MSEDKSTENGKRLPAFKDINSFEDIKRYLDNPFSRFTKNNDKMVYHYTNLDAAIKIISGGFWCLKNPNDMNDGLEPLEYNLSKNQIYFASFMFEQKESIAMWAMYAQPWIDGVMIAIPLEELKNWIKDSHVIFCADKESKKIITTHELKKAKLSASQVVYALKEESGVVLSAGSVKNSNFKDVETPLLSGYIKDDAWSYEKELRLRVDSEEDNEYGAVAVKIPDYIINSMVITKGPRFKGDLTERLQKEIHQNLKTDMSLFYRKLNYVPCDSCKTVEELKKLKEEGEKTNEQQLV